MHKTIFNFSNLNLQNSDKELLDNASFSITENEKIVVVGRNGTGKTTLIEYIFDNSKVTTGYAKQDVSKLSGNIVEFLQTEEDWWEILEILMQVFNLEISHNISFENISGGEKMKVLIAKALKKANRLILLDEPTNHLDLESIERLANYIKNDSRSYVIVSHDVSFINKIVDKITEIEDKKINIYGGNFDFYLRQKQQNIEKKQARFDHNRKIVKKLESEAKAKQIDASRRKTKMLNKIKSGKSGIPKIVAGGLIQKGEKIISKDLNRLETRKGFALERVEENKVSRQKQILFKIPESDKRGSFLNIIDGELFLDDKVLIKELNFSMKASEHVLITGNNGSGKTLLANNLSYNKHPNIHGEVIYGSEYKTFYLDQNIQMLDIELTPIENFKRIIPNISIDDVYKFLFSLGFTHENIKIEVKKLSGGEKLKLLFAIINASAFNLLILDEPSNNLDIHSKDVLIEILNDYDGAFVLISHDKNFFESIRLDRMYNIENNLLKLRL